MQKKSGIISIAVLPFQTISKEERIRNLFIGFVEDLIISFSKFIGLSVISSFTTSQIEDISIQSDIDKLSADYLIFGSVRQINHVLRISIQLIKTEDKSVVFSDQYDEGLDSILDVQDNIIQQVVSVLQNKINYNLLSYSYKKKSIDLAAYENYLMGLNILKKGSGDNDIKAREYFNAALAIDPNYSTLTFGLAYFGIDGK